MFNQVIDDFQSKITYAQQQIDSLTRNLELLQDGLKVVSDIAELGKEAIAKCQEFLDLANLAERSDMILEFWETIETLDPTPKPEPEAKTDKLSDLPKPPEHFLPKKEETNDDNDRRTREEEFEDLKDLFESCGYRISAKYTLLSGFGKKWTVTHLESNDKMGLYLWNGWSIEPLEHGKPFSENFPSDIYEWADMNDIELY